MAYANPVFVYRYAPEAANNLNISLIERAETIAALLDFVAHAESGNLSEAAAKALISTLPNASSIESALHQLITPFRKVDAPSRRLNRISSKDMKWGRAFNSYHATLIFKDENDRIVAVKHIKSKKMPLRKRASHIARAIAFATLYAFLFPISFVVDSIFNTISRRKTAKLRKQLQAEVKIFEQSMAKTAFLEEAIGNSVEAVLARVQGNAARKALFSQLGVSTQDATAQMQKLNVLEQARDHAFKASENSPENRDERARLAQLRSRVAELKVSEAGFSEAQVTTARARARVLLRSYQPTFSVNADGKKTKAQSIRKKSKLKIKKLRAGSDKPHTQRRKKAKPAA
ncbi:MAG: hypothetical protein CMF48_01215 [Legionellales bacterium]|nr:hypothetical protein [Legionellales bacterium]